MESVSKVTRKIILKLEIEEKMEKKSTAILASLRNSIGKSLDKANDVWPILYENVPADFLSENGKPTYQENAIFITLQLYALCKQGSSNNIIDDEDYKGSIGASLKRGRSKENQVALDRRFNVMITSSSFTELVYHLRQIVKLVKSKAGMKINFSRLANDLYVYQFHKNNQILFKWATDYYKEENNNRKEEEK